MPATPFYCNWCRERIGTYDDATTRHPAPGGLPDGPFRFEGLPDEADHLRRGVIHTGPDGAVVAYPCPHCGRNNLLQLPPAAEAG